MITNQNITDFKRKFEKIYRNLSERLDVSRWKNAVSTAREEDRSSAAAAVVDFLYSHKNLPSALIKVILHESDLRNCPSEADALFGTGVLKELHASSLRTDLIHQEELSQDVTEEQLEEILSHAEKAQNCLERGQWYLAGREIAKLQRICPENQGVRRLAADLERLRITGGIPSEVYSEDKPKKKKRADQSPGLQLEKDGSLEEAAAFFEKLIADNYENYEAYQNLGRIYFKLGKVSQADYIADLLMDLGTLESEARILKGKILESAGQKEDALYYYHTAFMYDRHSAEACRELNRILNELDPEREDAGASEEAEEGLFRNLPETDAVVQQDLFRLSLNGKTSDALKESDELIGKGRLSEAYYELSKASEQYPDTMVLVFKKAFVLYLMKRGIEARELLQEIGKEDLLYQKANDLIEDIDCSLRDRNSFSGASDRVKAEILFGAGRYEEALQRLKRISASNTDAQCWILKGRCEIETGHLDRAMEAFQHAVDLDPAVEQIHGIMAMISYVLKDYARAEELYDTAIRLSSSPRELCESKAEMLYRIGEAEKLIEFRKSAFDLLGQPSDVDGYAGIMMLNEDPDSKEAAGYVEAALMAGSRKTLFYKAAYKIHMKEEKYYRTLLCMNAGMAESEKPEQLVFFKACVLFALDKLNGAEIVAARCLTGERKDPRILFLMGQIQEASGNLSGALKWILEASVSDPNNHDYAFAIAEMYYTREEYTKAQVYYSKALVLDGEDAVSFKRRASIYLKQDNDRKAIEDLNCALLLTPEDPELYILMGDIVAEYTVKDGQIVRKDHQTGESADEANPLSAKQASRTDPGRESVSYIERGADYYYTRAIEAAPDQPEVYLHRAESYASQNRLDDAEADLNQALEYKPDSAKLHLMKGILLLMNEKAETASEEFEKVIRLDQGSPIGYCYASRCSLALHDYEDAALKAKKGLDLDNNYVDLYLCRGIANFYLKKSDEAEGDLTITIMRRNEIAPFDVEMAYRYRGALYEYMGRITDAVQNYELLLKLNPAADDVKKGIEELLRSLEEPKPKNGISSLFRKISDRKEEKK